MINEINRRFLTVKYPYADLLDQQRARSLLVFCSSFIALWLVWTGAFALSVLDNPIVSFGQYATSALIPIGLYGIITAVQHGYLRLALWALILCLVGMIAVPIREELSITTGVFMILPLVIAGLLMSRRSVLVITAIIIGVFILGGISQSQRTEAELRAPADDAQGNLFAFLSVVVATSAFMIGFKGNTERLLNQRSEVIDHYRILGDLGQRPYDNEYAIYRTAIEVLRQEFGNLFSQIYLADESGRLTRRIRVGQGLNARETTSMVDFPSTSIYYEALTQQDVLRITLRDPAERRAHLLPLVNMGVILPIINADMIIGVMDVQISGGLSYDDQDLLLQLATQIGLLVSNLRSRRSMQDIIRNQETAMSHLRTQLQNAQRGTSYERGGWDSFLDNTRTNLGFDIDGKKGNITAADELPETLAKALQAGEVIVEKDADSALISIPIMLRDEVLGAMQFRTQKLSRRQEETAQKIADRLAIALENRRLFDQSQAQANRERKASEVANMLITATEVDAVLDLAANSFNEALGAVQTRIHLQPHVIHNEDDALVTAQPLDVDIEETEA